MSKYYGLIPGFDTDSPSPHGTPTSHRISQRIYHVSSRGDGREPLYDEDIERAAFLDVCATALDRFDACLLAYCLMGNHYHLVMHTRQANLSKPLRHINRVYTQTYNRRHRKIGHLFQGRFKAILVHARAYL